MQIPILETERLVIRPLTPDDLKPVFEIIDCDCFGNCDVRDEQALRRREDWLNWTILGYEQHRALGHPPYEDRAIVQKGDTTLIGLCGLVPSFGPFRRLLEGAQDCNTLSAEMGLFYCIASEHRRRGFATEAASALMQFALETLQAGRLIATTESDNASSIGVMRKLGMTIHRNPQTDWPQVVGCRDNA